MHMTLDMPEEALAALRTDPENFARELRLAAAVKWYELHRISQERAAKIAGLSRTEFLAALGSVRRVAVPIHCAGNLGGSRP